MSSRLRQLTEMTFSKQGGQEYEFLSGKVRWAKLFTPSQYNKFTLDLCLDSESLGKVLELKKRGIKNSLKNDNGEYWITIASPARIDTKTGPKILPGPSVINKDGSPWDPQVGIGNDSDITVKVWVRKYKNPNNQRDEVAMRLYGVKVDTLVPFNPKADFDGTDHQRVQTEGLTEQVKNPW